MEMEFEDQVSDLNSFGTHLTRHARQPEENGKASSTGYGLLAHRRLEAAC